MKLAKKLSFLAILSVFFIASGVFVSANSLTNGLEFYFTFNETSGNPIDLQGNYTGTVNGTVNQGLEGKLNNSYNFTVGDGNGIELNERVVDDGAKHPSFNAWVNLENIADGNHHHLYGESASTTGWSVYFDDDELCVTTSGEGTSCTTTYNMEKGWTMISWNSSTTHITFWKNAVMSETHSIPGGYFGNKKSTIDASIIGARFSNPTPPAYTIRDSIHGRMDEVGLWLRQLTETEINQLYDVGRGLQYPFNNPANHSTFATFYPSTVTEGNNVDFGATVNISSEFSITAANFIYNGTVYSASIDSLGSNSYNLTRTLSIPGTVGAIDVYFNFSLDTGQVGNSTNGTVTASELVVGDCSSYSNVLYNFTLYNEKTLSKLAGAGTDSSVFISLYDETGTTLIANYSQTFTNQNPFGICLQDSWDSSDEYLMDLQVQYGATDYATEFYHIEDTVIDNSDMNTNISLYSLDNDTSQEFKIFYKDASFLPIADAIIQVERKYIGEGIFRTVERPKTDSNGETLAHLEREDAVYNFIVIVNGVIDATFNNLIAVCPNPTFDECEITLNNLESHTQPQDYTSLDDLNFTMTFNKDTRVSTTTFTIPSGDVATMRLNVTLFDALGGTPVCSDTLISSGGTLTCTAPTSFGNSTLIVELYRDNELVGRSIISLDEDPSDIYGNSIVWVALISFISLLVLGVNGNPIVMGLTLMLSSILLVALNIFYSPGWLGVGATILWFMIGVLIVVIRGVNR